MSSSSSSSGSFYPKNGDNESLFCPELTQQGTCLRDLLAVYAIDVSGSTSGRILQNEKLSASMLSSYVGVNMIVGWHSYASKVSCFEDLRSTGCTQPSEIVPYLQEAQALVLYTDGQIDLDEMQRFQSIMEEKVKPMPIIVIFTLSSSYALHSTILDIESQVNMSIPEACLALSNDVCLVVNLQGVHKVLMAKGAFSIFGMIPQLLPTTTLSELPDFDMILLKGDNVRFHALPPGYIRLNGFDDPLSLSALYSCDNAPFDVLEALCDRVYFPQLDISQMHNVLAARLRTLNENPQVDELNRQLAEIAVDPKRAGGEWHRTILQKLADVRSRSNHQVDANLRKARSLIHRFFNMLNEYVANRTSIALGSNRANRAKIIEDEAYEHMDLGDCVTVPECPIYLQEGAACILLQMLPNVPGGRGGGTEGGKEEFLQFCTNDFAMEAPFNFGKLLRGCVTRGVYSLEFARECRQNPFSRAAIIGYIPLSMDPAVIMQFMSKIFGGSRELWHFVRAYIAMMATHCVQDEWAQREIILPHLQALSDNYVCTYHLKGNTEDQRPFRDCLQYVTMNYGACLRDRYPDDTRTICSIVDLLMPEYKYPKHNILAMVKVIEIFARLLREYKSAHEVFSRTFAQEDSPSFVMFRRIVEVDDDYGHFVKERTDVQSVIARIFWGDANTDHPKYNGFKLQEAINNALNERQFKEIFCAAFAGEPYDTSAQCLQVALPEPSGVHFGEELYGRWDVEGRPKTLCVYCGEHFVDSVQMFSHLQKAFGPHFYNGQLAVRQAIEVLGIQAKEQSLFREAKQLLYKKYGTLNGALHTQHCKTVLLRFIRKFKEMYAIKK